MEIGKSKKTIYGSKVKVVILSIQVVPSIALQHFPLFISLPFSSHQRLLENWRRERKWGRRINGGSQRFCGGCTETGPEAYPTPSLTYSLRLNYHRRTQTPAALKTTCRFFSSTTIPLTIATSSITATLL